MIEMLLTEDEVLSVQRHKSKTKC